MSEPSADPIPPLHAAWIEALFAKLTVRYGSAFLDRWRDVDDALVKADWADQLAWFRNHPEAIKWALDNLPPSKPPTVGEFRALAHSMPSQATAIPYNPAPAKPDVIEQAMERVTKRPVERVDPKAWAKTILSRHEAGEKLTPIAVQFAKQALGIQTGAAA